MALARAEATSFLPNKIKQKNWALFFITVSSGVDELAVLPSGVSLCFWSCRVLRSLI